MAFSFVQTQHNLQSPAALTNVTTPVTPYTQGSLVILTIRIITTSNVVSSITDTAGNTYALAAGPVDTATPMRMWQYYGVQVTGGATSITVTFDGSITSRVVADEFIGGRPTNTTVFDASSTGLSSGGQNASAVTAFPPTMRGELVAAGLGFGSGATAITAGAGYVMANNTQTVIASMYRLASSQSETAPATWTTSNAYTEVAGAYIANSVSFRPSNIRPHPFSPGLAR